MRIGYRQPLVRTGSGRCLLAFMSARRRHRTLLNIHREDPAFDLDALEPELGAIRAAGHVARPSGVSEAVIDLSVPVAEAHEGGAIAALTCAYLRIRHNPWEPDALLAELGQAAARIAQGLAFRRD